MTRLVTSQSTQKPASPDDGALVAATAGAAPALAKEHSMQRGSSLCRRPGPETSHASLQRCRKASCGRLVSWSTIRHWAWLWQHTRGSARLCASICSINRQAALILPILSFYYCTAVPVLLLPKTVQLVLITGHNVSLACLEAGSYRLGSLLQGRYIAHPSQKPGYE